MKHCIMKMGDVIQLQHPYSQNLYNLLKNLEKNKERTYDFEELKFRMQAYDIHICEVDIEKNNTIKTYSGKSVDNILSKLDDSHEDFKDVHNAALKGEYGWGWKEESEETWKKIENMLSHGERDFKKLTEPLKKFEIYSKLDDEFIKNVIEIAKQEIEKITDLKIFYSCNAEDNKITFAVNY